MVYIVALVDRGEVRHKWYYDEDRYIDACTQLQNLLHAFSEVDEVCPILLKVHRQELQVPFKSLLCQYVL